MAREANAARAGDFSLIGGLPKHRNDEFSLGRLELTNLSIFLLLRYEQ